MNIGSVGRGVSTEKIRPLGSASDEVTKRRSVSEETGDDAPGVSVSLSTPVRMIKQLEELKKNDSEAFSQTLTQTAKALQRAAGEASGQDGEQLAALAERFASAAATGDPGALRVPTKQAAAGRDAPREVTGQAGRALSAYAKNTPDRARPSEAVERAMSATLDRIEEATRASQEEPPVPLGSGRYA